MLRKMDIDVDKARALDLANLFVDEHWKTLNEDDVTVSILRYTLVRFTVIFLVKRNTDL